MRIRLWRAWPATCFEAPRALLGCPKTQQICRVNAYAVRMDLRTELENKVDEREPIRPRADCREQGIPNGKPRAELVPLRRDVRGRLRAPRDPRARAVVVAALAGRDPAGLRARPRVHPLSRLHAQRALAREQRREVDPLCVRRARADAAEDVETD